MGLGKSSAVVIGSFALGESDTVVTFFSRNFGKVRGVAKRARRMPSKFGGALELLTLGELIFFDTGRSDLVRVDAFDIVRPFGRVREDLERLGETAWAAECVGRLTAERDPNRAIYGLLVRMLGAVEAGVPPRRAAVVFGVRCVDALGHRLRLDACVTCGRRPAPGRDGVAVDVDAGGHVRYVGLGGLQDAVQGVEQVGHDGVVVAARQLDAGTNGGRPRDPDRPHIRW